MQEFQTNKKDLTQSRIVDVAASTLVDGEVLVKIDRFAFTANNITYAVMGEQLRYWQFFTANDDNDQQWGIIPVWGFADVVESNSDDLPVGERLFGYFPPANEVVMTPSKVTTTNFIEASAHRTELPPGYNMYRRVNNEAGYDKANDNERMLLFVLHLTSFCLYDLLQSNNWYGAEQVVIISASSKTSTGLAYGLADDKNAAREYSANHQIVDIVKAAPASVTAQDFVDSLRKITPRLYSIASSQTEVEEEVHLTVGLVSYEENGATRFGGASGFLANDAEEGATVKVFVEHNDNFRLPADGNTPVIMVGPGTGVAPFRAFMQEREASDAEGENWMFFGDQTFTQDFLYQVEWQGYLKSGLLTKMDVAFSRDQAEKVYVQDRIKENAKEVFEWLERGAHLYICGDANRMAKDVHNTLVDVIASQGGLTAEQAEDYLKSLRSNKRYQKDVY
jgi:ferredoxin-NADP reductase